MILFDAGNWQRFNVISAFNEKVYTYIIGTKGETYATASITEELYNDLLKKIYTMEDLSHDAINKGFIAIEKEGIIVKCGKASNFCNKKCELYNKCSYCIIRKLQE